MSGYTPISTRESEVVLVRTSMLSQFTDFANVLKAFIGTSYISLPFAFYQSGLALGAAGLIVIALITNHCCELIIKCKNAAVKLVLDSVPQYRELQEEGCTEEIKQIKENIEREMSLGDISLIALGPWGIRIVNVALVLTQTGFCVAYFIFMGNTLISMFPMKFKAPLNTPNVTATVTTLFATLNDSNTVILGAHRLHQLKPALPCSGCTAHSMLTNSSTYNTALTGETTAPNFALLELIPLPFLILMAFIRNLRKLGPISAIANVALLTAFFGVLGYMLNGFHFKINDIRLASFATFPVFFGQLTCAYEGIGCIIPIESSMADNRPRFPLYLQLAISQVSVILGSFGILGYLIYGSTVPQIVTDTLPSGPLAQGIRITLCIAVLFTYPLQLFPVIEIFEGLLFSKSLKKDKSHMSVVAAGNSESTHLGNDSEYLKYQSVPDMRGVESPTAQSIQSSQSRSYGASQSINNDVKIDTPHQTPTWKRNLLRGFLVCVTAAIAWALRDDFAYVNAFIGSVGSSVLAYILPCTFHLVLLKHENSRFTVIKNICFIVFGIVGGIVGVAITIDSMVKSFTKH